MTDQRGKSTRQLSAAAPRTHIPRGIWRTAGRFEKLHGTMGPLPSSKGWSMRLPVAAALVPLFLIGCQPPPVDDALGWQGRGMSLPGDTGAGGTTSAAPGSDGAAGAGGTTGGGGTGSGGSDVGGGTGGAAGSGVPQVDSGTAPPPSDGGSAASTCHLNVTVTTHSTGRFGYDPRNVGAIWIETGGGKFVKSLNVWASRRLSHLTAWNGATSAAGLYLNRVDAVTAATLPDYGARAGSWNCTDAKEQRVALGNYQVCFDLNDTNDTSVSNCAPVTIEKSASTVKVPDALPCFTGRTFTFTP
jgi:hypothetical protein